MTIKPDGGGKTRVTDNKTDNWDPYWGSQEVVSEVAIPPSG